MSWFALQDNNTKKLVDLYLSLDSLFERHDRIETMVSKVGCENALYSNIEKYIKNVFVHERVLDRDTFLHWLNALLSIQFNIVYDAREDGNYKTIKPIYLGEIIEKSYEKSLRSLYNIIFEDIRNDKFSKNTLYVSCAFDIDRMDFLKFFDETQALQNMLPASCKIDQTFSSIFFNVIKMPSLDDFVMLKLKYKGNHRLDIFKPREEFFETTKIVLNGCKMLKAL